jgi:CDP-diacylglycerol---glycerol-3-phosphate 3-phosphatidyltransferase
MLVLVAFLAYPFPGARAAALLVFLFAAMTDWLDGWLARRMGQVSDFGKFMDALTDKIFTLGLFVSLLALLELEWALFPVLLILTREFLITGLRLVAAAKGVVLAAERAGKVKTLLQFCCLSLFLTEQALLHDWPFPGIDTCVLLEWVHYGAVFTLILATILTVTSGIGYMWRHVDLLFGENT